MGSIYSPGDGNPQEGKPWVWKHVSVPQSPVLGVKQERWQMELRPLGGGGGGGGRHLYGKDFVFLS